MRYPAPAASWSRKTRCILCILHHQCVLSNHAKLEYAQRCPKACKNLTEPQLPNTAHQTATKQSSRNSRQPGHQGRPRCLHEQNNCSDPSVHRFWSGGLLVSWSKNRPEGAHSSINFRCYDNNSGANSRTLQDKNLLGLTSGEIEVNTLILHVLPKSLSTTIQCR